MSNFALRIVYDEKLTTQNLLKNDEKVFIPFAFSGRTELYEYYMLAMTTDIIKKGARWIVGNAFLCLTICAFLFLITGRTFEWELVIEVIIGTTIAKVIFCIVKKKKCEK